MSLFPAREPGYDLLGVSIFATIFTIEDERQWISGLEMLGVKAGVIRDGDPRPEDLDAPLVYQGSHVLPGPDSPHGGSVGLACIPAHVRFWRDHPDAPTGDEPAGGCEPWLRLSVDEHPDADGNRGSATVLLTVEQAGRLATALAEWIADALATQAR
jgi:hypothetical protein